MPHREALYPRPPRTNTLGELGAIALAAVVIGIIMAAAASFGAHYPSVNTTDVPKTSQHTAPQLRP